MKHFKPKLKEIVYDPCIESKFVIRELVLHPKLSISLFVPPEFTHNVLNVNAFFVEKNYKHYGFENTNIAN